MILFHLFLLIFLFYFILFYLFYFYLIVVPYRDVRAFMRDEMDPPVYCSDRRLVKAASMLRVVAATHGKMSVSLLDCTVLQHVLWYHPSDQKVLREWLMKRVVPETGTYIRTYICTYMCAYMCSYMRMCLSYSYTSLYNIVLLYF